MDASLETQAEWKLKRQLRFLDGVAGEGTSMVSLVLPPGEDATAVLSKLAAEQTTAANIKLRVNRHSAVQAIAAAQQCLRGLGRVPRDTGVAVFCGNAALPDGRERMLSCVLRPLAPLRQFLYRCDSRFHTDALHETLKTQPRYGFVVLDGSGCLFAALRGGVHETLAKMSVDLPNKHGRGGQSALRFARLRLEKRHNYLVKVSETAARLFIADDRLTVSGLVVAGCGGLKDDLVSGDLLDPRLRAGVVQVMEVAYGGENGLRQAIASSGPALAGAKLAAEQRVLSRFFDEIQRDPDLCVFGARETLERLREGVVETVILWEDLEAETEDGADLAEWLVDHCRDYGCTVELVPCATAQGSQFAKGFGGVGGILRYALAVPEPEVDDADDAEW